MKYSRICTTQPKPGDYSAFTKEHLTDEVIGAAKIAIHYPSEDGTRNHNDRIRMCCAFLSAQKKANQRASMYGLKHSIENWCGCYVSESDVKAACRIIGIGYGEGYAHIRKNMTHPDPCRLKGIEKAFSHGYADYYETKDYIPLNFSFIEEINNGEILLSRVCKKSIESVRSKYKEIKRKRKEKENG
ncbi:MAG: hypothetical protein GX763_04810 [Clostridiaceae bacterium]|nr:hypothetical protein [Clostridiaceae bacterium]